MAEKKSESFSKEERAAMKARAQELRDNKNKEAGEKAVLSAIAAMKEPDHSMAKRIHSIVKTNAPALFPKTWYGMPAYINKEGKVICFFQSAQKFKTRYATFGFQHDAKLDDGNMWPVAFALKKLTKSEETKILKLVKKAIK